MEKQNRANKIQLDLEMGNEREEVVMIDDENQGNEQTEPPAGFKDLIYETWRDMQPPGNGRIIGNHNVPWHPDKNDGKKSEHERYRTNMSNYFHGFSYLTIINEISRHLFC